MKKFSYKRIAQMLFDDVIDLKQELEDKDAYIEYLENRLLKLKQELPK